MSAREFRRWRQYDEQYPIDDESVHVLPMAQCMSLIANALGGTTKPTDFMAALKARQTAEPVNLDAKFRAFFSALKKSPA